MHELPFTKSIYKSVMAAAEANQAVAVTRVVLEVGVLRDFIPEIVQKYWDYVAKGSIAEGSVIEIRDVAASARCRDCGHVYPFDIAHLARSRCPKCGCDRGSVETGRELRIMEIEISNTNGHQ